MKKLTDEEIVAAAARILGKRRATSRTPAERRAQSNLALTARWTRYRAARDARLKELAAGATKVVKDIPKKVRK